MALTIKTTSNTVPAAKVVPAKEVQDAAAAQGSPFAARAIAITKPKIRHETNQLNFETRNGTEFRFKSGTLPLTLSQEILVSDALSECARKIWLAHEDGHVADNDAVLAAMEAELRKDTKFAEILLAPKWAPIGKDQENFKKVQKTIGERIGAIFQSLTSAKAAARDTEAEYKRVEADIKKSCP
jgi:hypothetical protein